MTAVPAPGRATPATTAGAGTARTNDHWSTRAACRHVDPDLFFDGNRKAEAVHVCVTHCDVRRQCLAHAEQLDPPPFLCVVGGVQWGAHHRARRQPEPAARCLLCRWTPE